MKELFIFLLLPLLVPLCFLGCATNREPLEQTNRHLSATPREEVWNAMTNEPATATRLLVAQLMVIPDQKIRAWEKSDQRNRKPIHVITCLRMLRRLTGLEFRGKTTHIFGDTEDEETRKQLLQKASPDTVAFFAVWMSRDSLYIAPADAQAEIIEKWRNWCAVNGSSHVYKAALSIDDWYF